MNYIKRIAAFFYYLVYKYIIIDPFKSEMGKWFYDDGNNKYLLKHALNAESVVFEVGGYTGIFADAIVRKYGSEVYIFEPVSSFYNTLESKYSPNSKIHLFKFGLSDKDSTEFISLSADASSVLKEPSETKNKEEIIIKDIAEFMESNPVLQKVDLININIEGGEYALLERMVDLGIVDKFDFIQVQFHNFVPHAVDRRKELVSKLSQTHEVVFSYPFVWDGFKRR